MKILITGASRGIGLACAKKYLEMGHEVYGIDIRPAGLEDARYHHFVADITGVLPEIEGVEILVNNAARSRSSAPCRAPSSSTCWTP